MTSSLKILKALSQIDQGIHLTTTRVSSWHFLSLPFLQNLKRIFCHYLCIKYVTESYKKQKVIVKSYKFVKTFYNVLYLFIFST